MTAYCIWICDYAGARLFTPFGTEVFDLVSVKKEPVSRGRNLPIFGLLAAYAEGISLPPTPVIQQIVKVGTKQE